MMFMRNPMKTDQIKYKMWWKKKDKMEKIWNKIINIIKAMNEGINVNNNNNNNKWINKICIMNKKNGIT